MPEKKCHWNILLNEPSDRQSLVNRLLKRQYKNTFGWIADRKAHVISAKTILKFVDEELKHDNDTILKKYGQTLTSMSSGERKRTFLKHTLSQKPEVLILDHFFDNLDIQAKVDFSELLKGEMSNTSIINLYSRSGDELPFLSEKYIYHLEELKKTEGTQEFQHPETLTTQPIPEAIEQKEELGDCLVEFKDVAIAYGAKPVLKNINWRVCKGEFWHLKGPNGSGKTTLLSMIAGENPKAYGQNLYLFGQKKGSGESIWDIKRRIGYFTSNMTFQFWRMQPIRDMIISGFYDSIGLYKIPGDHQAHLADEWLRFLGLEKYANKPFIKMSLCHQRMVMIARAMVKHPPLLILDEPSVDLDENSAQLITGLINRIAHESDTTVVYVSHREEKGLVASHIINLIPNANGSVCEIKTL